MAETAYYYDLALADGYVFSEEELLPVERKLAENAEAQAASNINAKNYYTAYYGAGMTEAAYTAELTRQVKAMAYKDYLIRTADPTQADIDAYIAENSIPDYRTADLRIITLEAQPDRETGEVGPEQLAALDEKMARLAARYEEGESFEALQAAFSSRALGDSEGHIYGATRLDLPDVLADMLLFGGASAEPEGGYITVRSGNTAYFVILDAWGSSGPEREASLTLGGEALLAKADAEIAADYAVHRQRFGMLLATA